MALLLWLCEGVAFCEGVLVSCEAMELRLEAADGALLCSPFVSGILARTYQSSTVARLSPISSDFQQFIEWGDSQLYLGEAPGEVGKRTKKSSWECSSNAWVLGAS